MTTTTPTDQTGRPVSRPATTRTRFVRHYLLMVAAMYAGMLARYFDHAAVRHGHTTNHRIPEEVVMTTIRDHTVQSARPRSSRHDGSYEVTVHQDPTRLRAGTVAMLVGLFSQVPLESAHPHQEYANDSAAAFHEYAHSQDWVLVHLGQFVGVLVLTVGLVAVASSLARQRGAAGILGLAAVVTAVTSAAVFAVQMAVDGVALKAAVDAWVSATGGTDRDVAYQVAESIRSVEKGLSALFNTTNGITVLSLGAGLVVARGPGRRLGWLAAIAGVGLVAVGVLTARTGFSHEATSLMRPAAAVLAVFIFGMSFVAWRRRHT